MKIRRRGGRVLEALKLYLGEHKYSLQSPLAKEFVLKNLYFQMVDDMCYLDFCLGGLLSLLSTGTRCQGGGSE